MFNLKIAFDQPWWLLLLGLVPVLWIFSFRSLSGLGPYRRIFALLFRTAVFTMLVLALAGVQLQKISDRVTVIYLLDQSESIPKCTREAMLQYVMETSRRPPQRRSVQRDGRQSRHHHLRPRGDDRISAAGR